MLVKTITVGRQVILSYKIFIVFTINRLHIHFQILQLAVYHNYLGVNEMCVVTWCYLWKLWCWVELGDLTGSKWWAPVKRIDCEHRLTHKSQCHTPQARSWDSGWNTKYYVMIILCSISLLNILLWYLEMHNFSLLLVNKISFSWA